jgi:hypothetical protein
VIGWRSGAVELCDADAAVGHPVEHEVPAVDLLDRGREDDVVDSARALLCGLRGQQRVRSAGVGVLLLAPMPDHAEALAALMLFALSTAVSMAAASSTSGVMLSRGPVLRSYLAVVPALAALSLAFGAWYALGALNAAPYIF